MEQRRRSSTLTVQFILGERRLAQVPDAVGSWGVQKQYWFISQVPLIISMPFSRLKTGKQTGKIGPVGGGAVNGAHREGAQPVVM